MYERIGLRARCQAAVYTFGPKLAAAQHQAAPGQVAS